MSENLFFFVDMQLFPLQTDSWELKYLTKLVSWSNKASPKYISIRSCLLPVLNINACYYDPDKVFKGSRLLWNHKTKLALKKSIPTLENRNIL